MTKPHGFDPTEAEPHLLPLRPVGESTRLRHLVAAIVAESLQERRQRQLPPVRVEIDIPDQHAASVDADTLRAGLLPLVRAACQATALSHATGAITPRLCEVVVTSIDTGTAIEIEVADSGSDSPGEIAAATVAAVAKARAVAERCGGGVELVACPQGGLAVTLQFPHRRVRGLAA
jgi:hypothetical protein